MNSIQFNPFKFLNDKVWDKKSIKNTTKHPADSKISRSSQSLFEELEVLNPSNPNRSHSFKSISDTPTSKKVEACTKSIQENTQISPSNNKNNKVKNGSIIQGQVKKELEIVDNGDQLVDYGVQIKKFHEEMDRIFSTKFSKYRMSNIKYVYKAIQNNNKVLRETIKLVASFSEKSTLQNYYGYTSSDAKVAPPQNLPSDTLQQRFDRTKEALEELQTTLSTSKYDKIFLPLDDLASQLKTALDNQISNYNSLKNNFVNEDMINYRANDIELIFQVINILKQEHNIRIKFEKWNK